MSHVLIPNKYQRYYVKKLDFFVLQMCLLNLITKCEWSAGEERGGGVLIATTEGNLELRVNQEPVSAVEWIQNNTFPLQGREREGER